MVCRYRSTTLNGKAGRSADRPANTRTGSTWAINYFWRSLLRNSFVVVRFVCLFLVYDLNVIPLTLMGFLLVGWLTCWLVGQLSFNVVVLVQLFVVAVVFGSKYYATHVPLLCSLCWGHFSWISVEETPFGTATVADSIRSLLPLLVRNDQHTLLQNGNSFCCFSFFWAVTTMIFICWSILLFMTFYHVGMNGIHALLGGSLAHFTSYVSHFVSLLFM